MLASSPLHFVDRLPATLTVFGEDDASVPVVNGAALRDSAAARRNAAVRVRIQHAVGHDLDPVETPRTAGDFLRTHLAR